MFYGNQEHITGYKSSLFFVNFISCILKQCRNVKYTDKDDGKFRLTNS